MSSGIYHIFYIWNAYQKWLLVWQLIFFFYCSALLDIVVISSTSTCTPIYKAFAIRENIGDITAKGECTSNIADLVNWHLICLLELLVSLSSFSRISSNFRTTQRCSYVLNDWDAQDNNFILCIALFHIFWWHVAWSLCSR